MSTVGYGSRMTLRKNDTAGPIPTTEDKPRVGTEGRSGSNAAAVGGTEYMEPLWGEGVLLCRAQTLEPTASAHHAVPT